MARDIIYLNNAAAYSPDSVAMAEFAARASQHYQNQESISADTKKIVDDAERLLLDTVLPLHVQKYRVLFLHTGTDAVQAGLTMARRAGKGVFAADRGEHASVRAFLQSLPDELRCDIPLKNDGTIDFDAFSASLTGEERLVAVHFVQSETGVMQDLVSVREILRRKCPEALLFVDAIQGIGKVPFPFNDVQPDFLTLSGQKLGLPAGAALIYRADFHSLAQSLRFAEHRIGRVSPVFAEMLAETVQDRYGKMTQNLERVKSLRDFTLESLKQYGLSGYLHPVLPENVSTSPYILSFLAYHSRYTVYQGAILTRMLEGEGIYVSSGSACDAETPDPSEMLIAMGIDRKRAYGLLRISFSECTTECEIGTFLEKLKKMIEKY